MTDCFFCFLGRTFEDVAGKEGGREDVMYQTSPSYLFAPPPSVLPFLPTFSPHMVLVTPAANQLTRDTPASTPAIQSPSHFVPLL